MSLYKTYSHLLGVAYDDGDHDCYGLCRRYYAHNYCLELPNYARSSGFFAAGIDLITPFLLEEGFRVIDVPHSRLQPGDGLLICIPSREWPEGKVNHVGVFVGNGMFIHHLYTSVSCEDAMTPQWSRRVLSVVRHPAVTAANATKGAQAAINFLDLIPEHVKRNKGIQPPSVLGSEQGTSGIDLGGRQDRGVEEPQPHARADPDGQAG